MESGGCSGGFGGAGAGYAGVWGGRGGGGGGYGGGAAGLSPLYGQGGGSKIESGKELNITEKGQGDGKVTIQKIGETQKINSKLFKLFSKFIFYDVFLLTII